MVDRRVDFERSYEMSLAMALEDRKGLEYGFAKNGEPEVDRRMVLPRDQAESLRDWTADGNGWECYHESHYEYA